VTRPRRGSIRKSIDAARRHGRPLSKWMSFDATHRLICRRNRNSDRGSDLIATATRSD
jgi:hypothetical protein